VICITESNVNSLFLPLPNTQYEQLGQLKAHALRRLVKIPQIKCMYARCKPVSKQKIHYTIFGRGQAEYKTKDESYTCHSKKSH
jgi:hypothetical protein